MKKRNYMRLLLLLFAALTAGCSETELETGGVWTGETAIIEARISTRDVADGMSLGSAETAIKRVRVYAFDGNRLDKMIYGTYSASPDNVNIKMNVRKTSAKTLYVIVNEPLDEMVQSHLAKIDNPAAFDVLEYEIADYFTFTNSFVCNSAAKFDAKIFCLPMFGETETTIDTTVEGAAAIVVPMTVKRSLARVDVYMQKSASVLTDIKINATTTIDITNTRNGGYFTPKKTPSGDLTSAVGIPGAALTIPQRDDSNNDLAVRAFTIYTPERSYDKKEERLSFTLKKVDFGGGVLIDYDPVIIDKEGSESLTKIERNKVYRIYCTLSQRSNDVELSIKDWDDVPITGDIILGTSLYVDRSRVVMDYDETQSNPFSASVRYTSNGNVSFVGYVIKNADGTDKSITIDGTNLPKWLPKANITGLPTGETYNGEIGFTYVVTNITSLMATEVLIRIKTGNITKDITVIYDNGFIPSRLVHDLWLSNRPAVGVLVAKMGNVLPSEVADANWDREMMIWSPIDQYLYCSTNGGEGISNTNLIIASTSGPGSAAARCRMMGADWYFPSRLEISCFFLVTKFLGASYAFSSDKYWSSSDLINGSEAFIVSLDNANESRAKNSTSLVRCFKNI